MVEIPCGARQAGPEVIFIGKSTRRINSCLETGFEMVDIVIPTGPGCVHFERSGFATFCIMVG